MKSYVIGQKFFKRKPSLPGGLSVEAAVMSLILASLTLKPALSFCFFKKKKHKILI